MTQTHSDGSSFDKNIRSLLDAVAMFEREATVLLDRFGLDSEAVGRVVDLLSSLSVEAMRPLAAALGIADTATVEALMRDVRHLMRSEALLRREQAATAGRLGDLVAAVEALGTTTAGLADLQARLQERLESLAERGEAPSEATARRDDLADEVERLRTKIDNLEATLSTEFGVAVSGDAAVRAQAVAALPPGVKAGGARRRMPRSLPPSVDTHKILEGLPAAETKVRPA